MNNASIGSSFKSLNMQNYSKGSAQKAEEELTKIHNLVDQTDDDLRRALEKASNRQDQLNHLQIRSTQLLNRNEALVLGKNKFGFDRFSQ